MPTSIKVSMTTDKATIREMCQAMVAEAHPGYHGQSHKYVDIDTWEIHEAQTNRAWNPWSDNDRVVSVDECFDLENIDASAWVDWSEDAINLASWRKIKDAYCEAEDALEDNGDLADWFDYSTVIAWAEEQSEEWAAEIEAYEDAAHEAAIDLVESCLRGEIEIDS